MPEDSGNSVENVLLPDVPKSLVRGFLLQKGSCFPSFALGHSTTLWHVLTPRSPTQCFIDDYNWVPGGSPWHSLSGGSVALSDLLEAWCGGIGGDSCVQRSPVPRRWGLSLEHQIHFAD